MTTMSASIGQFIDARGQALHWQQARAVDMAQLELPGFPDIEQQRSLSIQPPAPLSGAGSAGCQPFGQVGRRELLHRVVARVSENEALARLCR
jgi:hypothetical protein